MKTHGAKGTGKASATFTIILVLDARREGCRGHPYEIMDSSLSTLLIRYPVQDLGWIFELAFVFCFPHARDRQGGKKERKHGEFIHFGRERSCILRYPIVLVGFFLSPLTLILTNYEESELTESCHSFNTLGDEWKREGEEDERKEEEKGEKKEEEDMNKEKKDKEEEMKKEK
jgi:hypothetical protein